MADRDLHVRLTATQLVNVINTQTEIARLGPDLASVMLLVAEHAQKLTQADGAVIEMLEGRDMVYRATTGIAEAQLGLRLPANGSLSGYCAIECKPVLCKDAEQDMRVDLAASRRVGLRSMVVVPLCHEQEVMGALKVMSTRVAAFTEADQLALEVLSDLVAASMYHAVRIGANELHRRATHDMLTGAPNRSMFYEHMRRLISQAGRQGDKFAVLFLDMDGLKAINDELGHAAGDAALREMANRLRECIRDGDLVARLGGDEFGVLLRRVGGPADIERVIERFQTRINLPFTVEAQHIGLSASIGMALFPEDGRDTDALLATADHAMYRHKRARRQGELPGILPIRH